MLWLCDLSCCKQSETKIRVTRCTKRWFSTCCAYPSLTDDAVNIINLKPRVQTPEYQSRKGFDNIQYFRFTFFFVRKFSDIRVQSIVGRWSLPGQPRWEVDT